MVSKNNNQFAYISVVVLPYDVAQHHIKERTIIYDK